VTVGHDEGEFDLLILNPLDFYLGWFFRVSNVEAMLQSPGFDGVGAEFFASAGGSIRLGQDRS